jgi:hypothetical protein
LLAKIPADAVGGGALVPGLEIVVALASRSTDDVAKAWTWRSRARAGVFHRRRVVDGLGAVGDGDA